MREHLQPSNNEMRIIGTTDDYKHLLAQIRQVQLEAALAGRIAESAFYAAEALALRKEIASDDTACVCG